MGRLTQLTWRKFIVALLRPFAKLLIGPLLEVYDATYRQAQQTMHDNYSAEFHHDSTATQAKYGIEPDAPPPRVERRKGTTPP